VLSILFTRNNLTTRGRVFLTGGIVAVVGAGLPLVDTFFASAGTEASGSADYRLDLLSLFSDMRLVGLSPSFAISPRGDANFGGFKSIDSALILLGLTYGFLPLVIVIAMLLIAAILLVRGKAAPPTIAIVAQIPALATVALITQYAVLLCFVGGLAVACQALGRTRESLDLRIGTIHGGKELSSIGVNTRGPLFE
jgi:hypothetical protein